jgi:hypothetical protein
MGSRRKLYDRIIGGRSDTNISFSQARSMLLYLSFEERVSGSHHAFFKQEIKEIINLQDVGGSASPTR